MHSPAIAMHGSRRIVRQSAACFIQRFYFLILSTGVQILGNSLQHWGFDAQIFRVRAEVVSAVISIPLALSLLQAGGMREPCSRPPRCWLNAVIKWASGLLWFMPPSMAGRPLPAYTAKQRPCELPVDHDPRATS